MRQSVVAQKCSVYLIESERYDATPHGALIKVGISSNPVGRLATFSTSCPFPLALTMTRLLPSREAAFFVERRFHLENAKFRMSGEWFEVPFRIGAMVELDFFVLQYWQENIGGDQHGAASFLARAGMDIEAAVLMVQAEYGPCL